MMDARWYERKWITKYPIMVEVFLDYGIVRYSFSPYSTFIYIVVIYYVMPLNWPSSITTRLVSWHQRIQSVLSAFGFQHFSL